MRFTILCGIFALLTAIRAEEGCVYEDITYPKGITDIAGKCQLIACTGGADFNIENCGVAPMPWCTGNSVFYEYPYDYSKNFPKCCPGYGCRKREDK